MFIFYDIETTGTNIVFDQILQFGAILVDEHLVEIDRFEVRCRLLPWVVPSPGALHVTQTPVSKILDPRLPDFFEMMRDIAARLKRWIPAIFIGYNSIRFDEPILQRAFWQALLPPYLTVTEGNSRLDLLRIARTAAYLQPGTLTVPTRDDGKPTFRLEELAYANGLTENRAHDALRDAEATLFLARLIAERCPRVWRILASRTSKSSLNAILAPHVPVFYFHNGGISAPTFCQRIDISSDSTSHAVLARLNYDWRSEQKKSAATKQRGIVDTRGTLFRVPLNKAPIVFSRSEIDKLLGLRPAPFELEQTKFLSGASEYCAHLINSIDTGTYEEVERDKEVEEMIFDGFASKEDTRLMSDFHRSAPDQQALIARAFTDDRFRRLARRILFVSAPQSLSQRERHAVQLGIKSRLAGLRDGQHRWRSILDALAELNDKSANGLSPGQSAISAWLQSYGST
jgi:exodeoxyribonuclease-1